MYIKYIYIYVCMYVYHIDKYIYIHIYNIDLMFKQSTNPSIHLYVSVYLGFK